MTEAASEAARSVVAGPGRLRAGVVLAIRVVSATCVVAAAWRRLEPPTPFVAPRPLVADMVYVRRPAGDGFWIDRFEATRGEVAAWLKAVGAEPLLRARGEPDAPEDHPAARLTRREAEAYARYRGKRLPTAAEWDDAARGPGGSRFPWGDGFVPACANTQELGLGGTARVGTFESGRTPGGVYDLVGNVAEWTASTISGGFDVRAVVRGASFRTRGDRAAEAGAGAAEADTDAPEAFASDLGFRCAADAAAAEDDLRLRRAVLRLGVSDPAGVLLQRRPAEATLRAGGARARRLLEETIALNVREGVEPVLSRARAVLADLVAAGVE